MATYADTPIAHATPAGRRFFQDLFASAHTDKTIYGFGVGDSQETYWGAGANYIPHLQRELFLWFRRQGATNISYGANSVVQLGLRTSFLNGTVTSPTEDQVLPGYSILDYNNATFGSEIGLRQHGESQYDAMIPFDKYFGKSIKGEVFAVTHTGSDDQVGWEARPTSSGITNNPNAPVTSSGTSPALGLDDPGLAMKSFSTTPLDYAGEPYMVFYSKGTTAAGVWIGGSRLVDVLNPGGMVIDWSAGPNYQTVGIDSVIGTHPNAGWMAKGFNADVIVIHTSSNDIWNDHTAIEQKARYEECINTLRGVNWFDNPTMPVIIIGDPNRTATGGGAFSPQQQAEFDQVPDMARQIVDDGDDYLLACNPRRLQEEGYNWSTSDPTLYTSDGVHQTLAGAIVQTKTDVESMRGHFQAITIMATTTIEIMLDVGTTQVFATSAGGGGTLAGSPFTATQIAGRLHKISIPDDLYGRWYFGGGDADGTAGFRVVNGLLNTDGYYPVSDNADTLRTLEGVAMGSQFEQVNLALQSISEFIVRIGTEYTTTNQAGDTMTVTTTEV